MNNQFELGTPLNIQWHFKRPDGENYSLTGQVPTLYCINARGRFAVPSVVMNAEGGYLGFTLTPEMQTSTGEYSFLLQLMQNGGRTNDIIYRDAVTLMRSRTTVSNQTAGTNDFIPNSVVPNAGSTPLVQLFTVGEFNLYQPTAPVGGSDGYWYFNGQRIVDEENEEIVAYYSIKFTETGEDKGLITVYKGRASGGVVVATFTAIKEALIQAVSDHNQAASDHTRANADHARADFDHSQNLDDHNQAASDHTRANEDHIRADFDHLQNLNDHDRAGHDHDLLINRIVIEYAQGESDSTPPDSGWSSVITSVEAGKYIWTRCIVGNSVAETVQYSVMLAPVVVAAKNDRTGDVSIQVNGASPVVMENIHVERRNPKPDGTDHLLAKPNKFYIWNESLTSLRIDLDDFAFEYPDRLNEFMFQFTTDYQDWDGVNPFLEAIVVWPETPEFEAGRTYQVSIVNGIGLYTAVGGV
ncbi:MAG: hypothetical protein J5732_00705 [Bacteroidaceae bacterium]|nr:hypothetical protein [Bacteroidaceae bacterium]